ncbi:hypothetical protein [Paenibacillus lutimineralis]|uniref:hypothetical protein n=1 Tax=Paenibacillus lutimineralis TaxID=2707005 RepID=UPI001D03A15A|nr:hypothetical protein [Paenibacillus lutimineralis]
MPGLRTILMVVLTWMLVHNILYTYIAPFLEPSGLGGRVDLVLLVFGLAAHVSIWVVGLLIDRMLRLLVLISLVGFVLTSATLWGGDTSHRLSIRPWRCEDLPSGAPPPCCKPRKPLQAVKKA